VIRAHNMNMKLTLVSIATDRKLMEDYLGEVEDKDDGIIWEWQHIQ
jgi:hypothetical protein